MRVPAHSAIGFRKDTISIPYLTLKCNQKEIALHFMKRTFLSIVCPEFNEGNVNTFYIHSIFSISVASQQAFQPTFIVLNPNSIGVRVSVGVQWGK